MTDLNKLRSEFEALPEVKKWIGKLIYGEKSNVYIAKERNEADDAIATWVNGGWFVWQEKAKAQAVPDTQTNDVLLNELHYFVDGQLYILENFDEHNKGFNKALKIVLKEIERIKKHGVSIREANVSGAEG